MSQIRITGYKGASHKILIIPENSAVGQAVILAEGSKESKQPFAGFDYVEVSGGSARQRYLSTNNSNLLCLLDFDSADWIGTVPVETEPKITAIVNEKGYVIHLGMNLQTEYTVKSTQNSALVYTKGNLSESITRFEETASGAVKLYCEKGLIIKLNQVKGIIY